MYQIIPPLHPLSPPAVSGGPWPSLSTASTAAPAARSRSTAAARPLRAAPCSGVRPQAPKGSETSTAGGLHPWLSTAHPPHLTGEARIYGVKSVSFIFSKIVQRTVSMAATIVAGVCEDHQDYELMEPSTTENPKKRQPFYDVLCLTN